MKSIKLKPELSQLNRLNDFVNNELSLDNHQISLIIEEVFINITKYSKCSYIKVNFKNEDDILNIQFIDNGLEFNPLTYTTPEAPESIDEAKIGGLGIHLVKNLADKLYYEYKNDENHLTIIKNVKK